MEQLFPSFSFSFYRKTIMKKLTFISIVFILLLIIHEDSYAQWSNDPNKNLRISNFGYFVDACEDGVGGAFVGWMTGNTSYPTVWVQWIDKYGYVRWDAPIHITGEGESQLSFRLIKAEPGAAIIYFRDGKKIGMEPPPSPWPIYDASNILNKIDTTGALLWGAKGIDVTTTKNIIDTLLVGGIDIIHDGEYGAYVTWMNNYGKYYDDSSITRIQRIGKDGQRLWGDEGRYIYTWHGINAPSPYLGQRKPDGVFLLYYKQNIGNTIVSFNPDMSTRWEKTNTWYPFDKLVPDENGGAAWARFVYPAVWDTGFTLIANRMDANGNLLWSDSGIVIDRKLPGYGYSTLELQQKLLKDESFIVLRRNYFQAVKKNGELVFKEKYYYSDSSKNKYGLGIFDSDSSNIIISWFASESTSNVSKCQKYSASLQKLWGEDITISTTTPEDWVVIPDNRGGLIEVFSVYYPTSPGILTQQVSSNGFLGEVLTNLKDDNISLSKDFHLYQNYPNPFNPSTVISYQLSAAGFVTLKVYDVLGNEVTTLANEEKPSGDYQVVFPTQGESQHPQLSSGVYFIELMINHSKRELIKCILLK